ncbi:FAD-dependent oxidoreductase [Alphaproteobacteria bacterium LSUCC0684]
MDKSNTHDIVIVGGGMAGLATALALADRGVSCLVLDHAAGRTDTIRTSTINPASHAFLDRLGVFKVMDDQGHAITPVREIRVSDAQKPRPGYAVKDTLLSWGEDDSATGPLAHVMRNSAVIAALMHLAAAHPLIRIRNSRATPPAPDVFQHKDTRCHRLDLDDGEVVETPLVIAADGGRSPFREAALIRTIRRSPGQTAIVADIRSSLPHRHIAWQRFVDGGPVALMPLDDPHLSSLVWTLRDEDAAVMLKADPLMFGQVLEEEFGPAFGELSLASERHSWSMRLCHAIRPFAHRLVLVGDAAHSIHHLAGQGYNLALGDAAAISDALAWAMEHGADFGDPMVLERYARQRFVETAAMTVATDGLNRLFSFGPKSLRSAAGMAMAAMDRSPFKALAMKMASGGLNRRG